MNELALSPWWVQIPQPPILPCLAIPRLSCLPLPRQCIHRTLHHCYIPSTRRHTSSEQFSTYACRLLRRFLAREYNAIVSFGLMTLTTLHRSFSTQPHENLSRNQIRWSIRGRPGSPDFAASFLGFDLTHAIRNELIPCTPLRSTRFASFLHHFPKALSWLNYPSRLRTTRFALLIPHFPLAYRSSINLSVSLSRLESSTTRKAPHRRTQLHLLLISHNSLTSHRRLSPHSARILYTLCIIYQFDHASVGPQRHASSLSCGAYSLSSQTQKYNPLAATHFATSGRQHICSSLNSQFFSVLCS